MRREHVKPNRLHRISADCAQDERSMQCIRSVQCIMNAENAYGVHRVSGDCGEGYATA